jgi:hypothetical protein
MVAVAVGNDGTINWFPGVNIKVTGATIQTAIGEFD